jgi:hypothetical protein
MGMSPLYKAINKLMVQGGINFGTIIGGSKLDSKLEGRRGWFTIVHVKSIKNVTSILILGKKNSFIGLQKSEAKEIVQKT